MSQEIEKIRKDSYKIHSYEMDVNGAAPIHVLCKYMQESAWHHAENLQVGYARLLKNGLTWVLAQQLIHVDRFPNWGEQIEVHTWPSNRNRLAYYRDFRILDATRQLIAVAQTKWYAINLKTRRPESVDSFFNYELDTVEQAMTQDFAKLPGTKAGNITRTFQVLYGDLDVNEHVNNVRYIEWVLDTFTLNFRRMHKLRELEIVYLAEALYDDELSVATETNSATYEHSLIRNADRRELCRVRTRWSNKNDSR